MQKQIELFTTGLPGAKMVPVRLVGVFPYRWRRGQYGGKYPETGRRKGQPVRVIAAGAMTPVLAEFDDAERFIVSRKGLRREA